MFIMLPQQMESAKKFGTSRIMDITTDKNAKNVALNEYTNIVSKKSRRFRSAFTTEQLNSLEKEFQKFPYIGISSRKEIADILNISDKAVKIWFQNRRMREKKENGTIYITNNHAKSNTNSINEQNNNNNSNKYSSANKLPQTNEKISSNEVNNYVSKDSKSNTAIFLSSQNKSKHFESASTSQPENKYDTPSNKTNDKSSAIISPTSSTLQGNMASFHGNTNRTTKYFENKNKNHSDPRQRRDLPQDLSSKKRLTHDFMSSNQQYVSVNFESGQNYKPMSNSCAKSMAIGAAVKTGITVPTRPKISQSDNSYETSIIKPNYEYVDRFSNLSPVIQNNAIISTPGQGNMCTFYDNPNRKTKYCENKNRVRPDPQDLSSKKRSTYKSISSNPQYVPVNLNSDQNYIPMYNFCNKPLPIGATVSPGVSVPTQSTMPQGNVIWKPVNMLSGSGLSSSGIVRGPEISSMNLNTTRSCSCNCHEHSQSHSAFSGYPDPHRPQPQYLLAIPLNSACNQL